MADYLMGRLGTQPVDFPCDEILPHPRHTLCEASSPATPPSSLPPATSSTRLFIYSFNATTRRNPISRSSISNFSRAMIIKGIFRRYERWNPVHPTAGAFWGMGIGVGCGVGWGPGFGPEVIGYVGAGCGAGFSVGLTLAGIGLGLPANSLLQFPFSGTLRIAENALSPARFIAARDIVRERWKQTIPHISLLTRRNGSPLSYGVDLLELMKPLTSFARPALECLDSFISCHVSPGRDPSKSSRRSKG